MGIMKRRMNVWGRYLRARLIGEPPRTDPFDAVLQKHTHHHDKLRRVVAGIVDLRNQLTAQREALAAQQAATRQQLRRARREDEKTRLEARIEQQRQQLRALSAELAEVTARAEEAKRGLLRFGRSLERLRRERDVVLQRWQRLDAREDLVNDLQDSAKDDPVGALSAWSARIRDKDLDAMRALSNALDQLEQQGF